MRKVLTMIISGACALSAVGETRRISVDDYRDKMKGGWTGQMAGVSWGVPTEFKTCGEIMPESAVPAWKPEMINRAFDQDDLYAEMTFIKTLADFGWDVPIRQAGIDFANSGYRLWHANHAGRRNLRNGIAPPDSSHPKYNPCANDIDYQIEADFSGLVCPGCPQGAIVLGEKFGRLMNYGDGLYAGQFIGGMYAAAFFETDRLKIVESALACIPAGSRYAEMVRYMLDEYRADPADWQGVWKTVFAKYGHEKGCPGYPKGEIDATLNGAMVLLGYLWGGGDPDATITIAMRGGFDSDCNPSSAAGVLFTSMGFSSLPERFAGKVDDTLTFSFTDYNFSQLLDACEVVARQAVVANGGRMEKDASGQEWFVIPVKDPMPSACHSVAKPGPEAGSKYTDAERARIFRTPEENGPVVHEVFANPPSEARLQMWYHWVGDCVTEAGLIEDFKAMGEIGVGTAHIFAPSMADLPVKAKPMDAEWMRLFTVAIREAKTNGMTLGFHNCPGWSSSGGPWITPENSMKKVVFSEIDVDAASGPEAKLPQPPTVKGFYRDIAVYAFPVKPPPRLLANPLPKELGTKTPGTSATFDLEYAEPFRPRFFLCRTRRDRVSGMLTVSAEIVGRWEELGRMEMSPWHAVVDDRAVRLAAHAPASRYRIAFTSTAFPEWMGQHDTCIESATLTELPLVENVVEKNSATDSYGHHFTADPGERGLDVDSVVDLTSSLKPDGNVSLAQLSGFPNIANHRILRIGFTSTGRGPGPATIEGLECDKLDRRGIDAHWAAMPAKILALPGAKETVEYAIIDSYEVGGQNWTEILPSEFEKRRGYPLGVNLLTVCGYALGTSGDALRFLWDWQKTIGELFAENYYDRFSELCHQQGVKSVIEPYGGPFDAFRSGRSADVPTGEFWLGRECYASPRIAASLGHLHGHRRIATESFTTDEEDGRWTITPHRLRVAGDEDGWLNGINQLVLHSYLHQPFTQIKPGLSLGRHGTQFNRNTTWWKEGRHWADYVRRGQALLQYGEPVAEVLLLGGPLAHELVKLGFNYDFCGESDIDLLEIRDGRLAVKGGGEYEMLVIQEDERRFSPERRAKLAELERQGAKIFRSIAPEEAVRRLGLPAPFQCDGPLKAIRRIGADGESIWFVVNASATAFNGQATFAAPAGTSPERFDAKDGSIHPLAASPAGRGLRVELDIPPHGSTFVVFSRNAGKAKPQLVPGEILKRFDAGWTIASFTGPSAPRAPMKLDALASWSESSDSMLRHFAGRAVYVHELETDAPAFLDLGEVKDVANIRVDGRFVACLWEPPFQTAIPAGKRLEVEVINTWPNRMIGDAIARKSGVQEPIRERWPAWVLDNQSDSGTGIFTWSNWLDGWRADDALLPAGLIGPVVIRRIEERPALNKQINAVKANKE